MNAGHDTVPPQRETSTVPEIVAATDGSAAAAVAVQYALDVATTRGNPVRILHAVPTHLRVPQGLEEAVQQAGSDLVFDVGRRAQLAAPSVDVHIGLLQGPKALQLISAVHGAELVVLGRSTRVSHVITGSTVSSLIEHTDRPVRVIPPDWFKRTTRSEVIVAVKEPKNSHALIERGFEIAAELGEPLVLLHVWGLPSGYEEVMALADTASWNAHLTEAIETETKGIRESHPEVPYQIRVVHGRTVNALEEASRRASFLLIGRPSHHNPVGPRTDVPHLLANISECPVEIGPESRPPAPSMDLELESHGRMLR